MCRNRSSEPGYPLARAHYVRELHAELVVHHYGLAPGDEPAVYEYLHRLAGELLELHDRTLSELEEVLHEHPRPAHLDRDGKGDIEEHVHVRDAPGALVPQVCKARRPCLDLFLFRLCGLLRLLERRAPLVVSG